MSENNGPEGNSAINSHETGENEEPEIHTLTQKEVNEHIKSFIAPLTRQLKYLTRLVEGLSVASHPNHYPLAETDAGYNAHEYSPDKQCPDWKNYNQQWYFKNIPNESESTDCELVCTSALPRTKQPDSFSPIKSYAAAF